MNEVTRHSIKDVVRGRASRDGQAVHFDLRFDDGRTDTFVCQHQRLGHVLTTLHALAGKAAQARTEVATADETSMDIQISEPFETRSVAAGVLLGTDLLAVRVETEHELAIDIALSVEQARDLIESLKKSLGQMQPFTPTAGPH